jgi:hypothetical protein
VTAVVVLAACVAGTGPAEAGAGSAEEALAERILAATGVKGGLVVHIGCGDGKLTAALAGRSTGEVKDAYLVHGLARGDKELESARARVKSRRLYGKVSIGRLGGRRRDARGHARPPPARRRLRQAGGRVDEDGEAVAG